MTQTPNFNVSWLVRGSTRDRKSFLSPSATGESRMSLVLSSGTRTGEIRDASTGMAQRQGIARRAGKSGRPSPKNVRRSGSFPVSRVACGGAEHCFSTHVGRGNLKTAQPYNTFDLTGTSRIRRLPKIPSQAAVEHDGFLPRCLYVLPSLCLSMLIRITMRTPTFSSRLNFPIIRF